MELERDTCIEIMQRYVAGLSLEDKSLEWLRKKSIEQSMTVANCERSAREIRKYVINQCKGVDEISELVKERKDELVEAIELQAELSKVIVKWIDDEIAKRQETK